MAVTGQTALPLERTIPNASRSQPAVETQSKQKLSECPYSYYFQDVTIYCVSGVLTLRGRVPTFYMKQIAQSLVGAIEGVSRIDNCLDVVNATGLSSVRQE